MHLKPGGKLLLALLGILVGLGLGFQNYTDEPFFEGQAISAPAFYGRASTSIDSPAVVEQVGQRLALTPLAAQSTYNFTFQVLPERQFKNAFVLPTGGIYITAGLLQQLETEAELAAVLSHEIGHILARPAAGFLSGFDQQMVAANTLGEKTPAAQQAEELQADFLGVCILNSAGYDPQAFISLMDILNEAYPTSERPPGDQSDHPTPSSRQAHLRDLIDNLDRCP